MTLLHRAGHDNHFLANSLRAGKDCPAEFLIADDLTMLKRREFIATTTLAAGLSAATALSCQPAKAAIEQGRPFRYCLNTSTIRGQKLPIVEEIKLVGDAGYDGIEPWINEIDAYQQQGGSLPDLSKRIADAGLTVESAIGFAAFLVDDPAQRQKGLDEARRCMKLVKALGDRELPPLLWV